jgi:very-short-patch-repair endonuclease
MGTFSHYKDTPKYITELSRSNRSNPTEQEEKLWIRISTKKLNNTKFRRQVPIGRYIVDFYNHDHKIIIEIDGVIHQRTEEYDNSRTAYLEGCGYKVMRFTNDEIDTIIEAELRRIETILYQVPFRGRFKVQATSIDICYHHARNLSIFAQP